ncbi:MAG: radical SAM protein [Deltaproteobacteria bacterium]|nr:radical SAM protein [Deltaproteobacteria bacterium]
MITGNPRDYTIEAGPMGPIGEGETLIVRINRNCPWNRCLFCPVYKDRRFSPRPEQDILGDIDAVSRTWELLEKTSWEMGLNGRIRREVVRQVMAGHPGIYGAYPDRIAQEQWAALGTLNNVANWLLRGGRRIFLQDANALATKTKTLVRVLQAMKKAFPTIDTVTCYARSRTLERHSLEELRALKEAGLTWAFVGIESGCDEVLKAMKKGVDREAHVAGGRRFMEAGLHMAAFIMPGLAGNDAALSRRHVEDTVAVLNEIRPDEVRVRSLAVIEDSPLYSRVLSGDFSPPGDDRMIEELAGIIQGLAFDCTFETLQMTNPLFSAKGPLSETRKPMIETIERFLVLSPLERARFLLARFVNDGYLACVEGWGKLDTALRECIEDAAKSLERGAADAVEKAAHAVFAIKSKGIP